MGLIYDGPKMTAQVLTMNEALKFTILGLDDLRSEIMRFVNDTELQGDAYSAAKSYFHVVWVPIVNGLQEGLRALVAGNQKFLSGFRSIVGVATTTFLNTDSLDAAYETWMNYMAMVESQVLTANGVNPSTFAIVSSAKEIKRMSDALHQFDPISASYFEEAKQYFDDVRRGLEMIESGTWNGAAYDLTGKDMTWSTSLNRKLHWNKLDETEKANLSKLGYTEDEIIGIVSNLEVDELEMFKSLANENYREAFKHSLEKMRIEMPFMIADYIQRVNKHCVDKKDMKMLQNVLNGLSYTDSWQSGDTASGGLYASSIQNKNLIQIREANGLQMKALFQSVYQGKSEGKEVYHQLHQMGDLDALMLGVLYMSNRAGASRGSKLVNLHYDSIGNEGFTYKLAFPDTTKMNEWKVAEESLNANTVVNKDMVGNKEYDEFMKKIRETRESFKTRMTLDFLADKVSGKVQGLVDSASPVGYMADIYEVLEFYTNIRKAEANLDEEEKRTIQAKITDLFLSNLNNNFIGSENGTIIKGLSGSNMYRYANAVSFHEWEKGGLLSLCTDKSDKSQYHYLNEKFNGERAAEFKKLALASPNTDEEVYANAQKLVNGGYDFSKLVNGTATKADMKSYNYAVELITNAYPREHTEWSVSDILKQKITAVHESYREEQNEK